MDKNQEFYQNKNKYGNICIPVREGILNYLIKEKFLSEFKTEEEKLKVLQNLGIQDKLEILTNTLDFKVDLLQRLINNKVNISQLAQYVTYQKLLERLELLRPKDEKSKGFYSSFADLLDNNPSGEPGDWAIVDDNGVWYIYKYNNNWVRSGEFRFDMDLSGYAKLTDLEMVQELLISGINIKTINGESLLGEGNIEIRGGGSSQPIDIDLSDYVTKEYLYNIQNPLTASMSVSPSLSEYTGRDIKITIKVTAKKGSSVVTPDSVSISFKNNSNVPVTDGTYITNISDRGTTTFTAVCTYGEEQATCSGYATITLPIYYGFSSASSLQSLELSTLAKRVSSGMSMTQTIQNSTSGNYLWIVTPYTLNAVATDAGYTYKVAMSNVGSRDGLNYYRSNSAVDISNLTYYIK